MYERERLQERERISRQTPQEVLLEIGRFGVVDPRYYDDSVLRDIKKLRAARIWNVHLSASESTSIAFLTPDGRGAARQLAERDMVIDKPHSNRLLHDLAVHRLYYEEKRAIEKDGGEVIGIRTEKELKRDLGRAIGRSRNVRTDVQEFARANDLSVIDGGLRIPDCRVVYIMDGITRHLDLEIMSAHRNAPSVKAKVSAGMRVVDRTAPKRPDDSHHGMANLLR